ncbi:DUF397 domain-containing protein [Streptomyces mobaraensis]|uniref:DUF397 domain-containing protein n=1 Tax=Streptomyces mobaraensis TaxID=35621 RepID=A0A5N5VZA4_STRMB|nr:DUF397 domain-containing protein [Streptomyces mobaraensis]
MKVTTSVACWVKSSHSHPDGTNCVEIGLGTPGFIPVRDSKTPDGFVLRFPAAAFAGFVSSLKDGNLDS